MVSEGGPRRSDEEHEGVAANSPTITLLPDPGLMWQAFRRNLFLFSVIVLSIIALTVGLMAILSPQYLAISSVLIEPTGDPVQNDRARCGAQSGRGRRG